MEDKKKGTLILDLSDPRTVEEGITALTWNQIIV